MLNNHTLYLLLTLLTVNFGVAAKNIQLDSQCNIHVEASLELNESSISIDADTPKAIVIDASGNSFFKGTKLNLSPEQQAIAREYYAQIKQTVPLVIEIASGAVKVTQRALIEVFSGLFGEDSQFVRDLDTTLNNLYEDIRSSLVKEQGQLAISRGILDANGEFAEDVKSKVDSIFAEYTGRAASEFIKLLAQSLMQGDSKAEAIQERFAGLEKNLEQTIEQEVSKVEAQSDELCERFKNIDALESQLNQIDELADLNLLKYKQKA